MFGTSKKESTTIDFLSECKENHVRSYAATSSSKLELRQKQQKAQIVIVHTSQCRKLNRARGIARCVFYHRQEISYRFVSMLKRLIGQRLYLYLSAEYSFYR